MEAVFLAMLQMITESLRLQAEDVFLYQATMKELQKAPLQQSVQINVVFVSAQAFVQGVYQGTTSLIISVS